MSRNATRRYAEGLTATEARLARTWEEVLGVERVGIDDAYYELGGDSLQGIRLVGALRRGGFQVALQDLFRLQTIRELVDHGITESTMDTEDTEVATSEPFSLVPEEDRGRLPSGVLDAYPATQLQLGMIFHTDLDPAQATFHDLIRYEVELPFDADKLTSLLAVMVERHEVLRTSFALGGYSRPLQLVHDHGAVNLAVHDLSHLSAAHQTAVLDDWFDGEKSTGFLWSAPTLMRFFVHRRNPGSFSLSVSFHHSIIDGWSFSGLMAGLLEDYRRAVNGLPGTATTPPPLAYRDYVRLELDAQQDKAGRDYWIGQLAGAPTTRLPRLPEADVRWAEAELTLDEDQYSRLTAVAARYQAPVKHLCLAVHLRALALISREVDVTTGVFGHGRPEHPEADRMVGLFLNILPTRITVPGGWDELIAEVTRLDHQHIPHRRFSYASIQQATGGERLVETAFNFVNFSAYADQLGTAGKGVIGGVKWFEHADFALLVTFNADLFANRLKVNFNAAAHVLGRDAVRAVASVYRAVLADLIGDRTSEQSTDPNPALAALLAELPMTAAGPASPVPGPVTTGLTGATELSELLANICGVTPAELAGIQPDSLAAVHIKYALHARFGLTVTLQEILGADLTTLGQ